MHFQILIDEGRRAQFVYDEKLVAGTEKIEPVAGNSSSLEALLLKLADCVK
mgnify:CR=1 FL=1